MLELLLPFLSLLGCHGTEPPAAVPASSQPQPAGAEEEAATAASARVSGEPVDLSHVSRWTRPRVPDVAPPEGLFDLSASTCGACHPEIAAEWAASTHGAAWVDPQFQAELHKDPSVSWLCINCHTPLTAQQERLVVEDGVLRNPGTEPNPSFSPALREEGITCLTCHWRPDGIAAVHEDAEAPHPLVFDGTLSEADLCMSCHQAMARVEEALVCHFDTGSEWKAANPGKPCQGCHMEPVERVMAVGGPVRQGGRHLWPGSLLPKRPWTDAQAAMFASWEPGIDGTVAIEDGVAIGRITNARAGHKLPTGDPERHFDVKLQAFDADGAVLVEQDARIGQVWEWWPEAKKLADNRLLPGETREVRLDLPPGAVRAVLKVDHVRISEENAAFHKLEGYPTRRTVLTATVNR